MVRQCTVGLLKQTGSYIKHVVGKAFSSKYLLMTNITISAVMSGSADGLVQKTCRHHGVGKYTQFDVANNYKTGGVDGSRIFRMSTAGLCAGAIGHYWYLFLDKQFVGNTFKIVVKKTLFDQIFFAPVGIGLFFVLLGALEGSSLQTIKSEVVKKGPEVILVDWLVYPPAQYVNFTFLPTRFRILYDNVIAFCLDIYYSHMKYER